MLKGVEKSRRLNQMAFLGSTPVILSSTSSLGIILTYRITIIKRKKQKGLIFSVNGLQGLEKKKSEFYHVLWIRRPHICLSGTLASCRSF